MTQNKENYKKLNEIEHVFQRPDTYLGNTDNDIKNVYVYDNDSNKIIKKDINYNQGFVTIHNEIIYNAIDNISRSSNTDTPCTEIKLTITDNNMISISNNGLSIPIEKTNDDKWLPSTIFGELRTGSNFNDKESRYTSGRNGFGSKLTNVFSTYFEVEIHDPKNNRIYKQTWKENLSIKEEPIIKEKAVSKGLVRISWIPDFKYFKIKDCYDDDYIMLLKKLFHDIAGQHPDINIYFNGEKIKYKSFIEYCILYDNVISITDKKIKGEYIFIQDNIINYVLSLLEIIMAYCH